MVSFAERSTVWGLSPPYHGVQCVLASHPAYSCGLILLARHRVG